MRLTRLQREALAYLRQTETAQVMAGDRTWADRWTTFVHWQTAEALERRGLVRIDDGDVLLTPLGAEWAGR